MSICDTDGCGRKTKARGYCHRHYEALRRNGLMKKVRISDPAERVTSYIDMTADGCWIWTGARSTGNYGRIFFGGRVLQAHRVVYQLHRGPIPEGLELDHICHTADTSCPGGESCPHRPCVNPDHLQPVTGRENKVRGRSPAAKYAANTHCPQGHPFSPENTYIWRSSRICRTCRVAAQRKMPPRPRRSLDATCVICSASFTYVRGPGGRAPNTCSDQCTLARRRRAARDHQRRKRAAQRST